jgi:hypothetical protein
VHQEVLRSEAQVSDVHADVRGADRQPTGKRDDDRADFLVRSGEGNCSFPRSLLDSVAGLFPYRSTPLVMKVAIQALLTSSRKVDLSEASKAFPIRVLC